MDEVHCIEPEAVAEALALPAEHPVRRHARRCPRCHALLEGYRVFLAPPEVRPEHEWPTAERRLDALRAELTGTASAVRAPSRAPDKDSWWARLLQPALRPAWGFAAAALVLAFVLVLPRLQSQRPGSTLRGTPSASMLAPPVFDTDGTVHLSWSPHAGATAYRVIFYSLRLAEIARRDAGTATALTLTPSELPDSYRAGESVLYRVQALANGDAIAISEVGTLHRR